MACTGGGRQREQYFQTILLGCYENPCLSVGVVCRFCLSKIPRSPTAQGVLPMPCPAMTSANLLSYGMDSRGLALEKTEGKNSKKTCLSRVVRSLPVKFVCNLHLERTVSRGKMAYRGPPAELNQYEQSKLHPDQPLALVGLQQKTSKKKKPKIKDRILSGQTARGEKCASVASSGHSPLAPRRPCKPRWRRS